VVALLTEDHAAVGRSGRARIVAGHGATSRAEELERHLGDAVALRSMPSGVAAE
jgi:hypothetical protein